MSIKQGTTLITPIVRSALSKPELREVENITLDGQPHLQTIGTGATVVDVVGHFTMEQKIAFEQVFRTKAPITVVFDGRWWTGIVARQLQWYFDFNYSDEVGSIYTAQFTLLVQTEGAV